MTDEEIKTSKDGKCPNCKSENKTFLHFFDTRASSTPEYPKPTKKVWKCLECKESFYITKAIKFWTIKTLAARIKRLGKCRDILEGPLTASK